MPFHIALEANVGVGKSTVLNRLESKNVKIFSEPVQYWRDTLMLEKFYNQPMRWAFTFQTMVLNSFHQIAKENICNSNVKLTERSLLSSRHCFSKLARHNGYLNKIEYEILEQSYKLLDEKFNPDYIIYLTATPELAYRRIKERGRPEESNITLEYLTKLDVLHNNLFLENTFNLQIPISIVDANQSSDQVVEQVKNLIESKWIRKRLDI
jgi:deoxyadenosine/deoxycytidine kinase